MLSVLRAPGYEEVDEQWFTPAYWGEDAVPVTAGGRGSAWFVRSSRKDMVLRHYRRGGLVARFFKRSYFFTGLDRARSIMEFKLLCKLQDQGLPVPRPVAALVSRPTFFSYTAAILIEKIEGAKPLPEHPSVHDLSLWHKVGATIAKFHQKGLDHVDLNCDNILVANDQVYLIDFDRCRLRRETGTRTGWASRNMKRLRRSFEKRCPEHPERPREELWRQLMDGYGQFVEGDIGEVFRGQ